MVEKKVAMVDTMRWISWPRKCQISIVITESLDGLTLELLNHCNHLRMIPVILESMDLQDHLDYHYLEAHLYLLMQKLKNRIRPVMRISLVRVVHISLLIITKVHLRLLLVNGQVTLLH